MLEDDSLIHAAIYHALDDLPTCCAYRFEGNGKAAGTGLRQNSSNDISVRG